SPGRTARARSSDRGAAALVAHAAALTHPLARSQHDEAAEPGWAWRLLRASRRAGYLPRLRLYFETALISSGESLSLKAFILVPDLPLATMFSTLASDHLPFQPGLVQSSISCFLPSLVSALPLAPWQLLHLAP